MELIFLGTGAGLPSKKRNVSAIALSLLQELNEIWLFDCGEATQHQILHTSIKPSKISKVFITHLHGDHLFGLPGFLSSRSFQGGKNDPLTVYGPPGIRQYIKTNLMTSDTHLSYPLHVIEYREGIIIDDEKFTVSCKKLDHRVSSYGFRITEKNQLGELLVDKLKHAGVQPGPIYRKIKANEQTVLEDGTVINRLDYLGPVKQGKVISIFGDTTYRPEHVHFIKNSNVLVHEATFSSDKAKLAKQYYHSTTTEAAMLAKKAQVKKLILTHISSRYQDEHLPDLLDEAQMIFKNTSIANDFDHFSVE